MVYRDDSRAAGAAENCRIPPPRLVPKHNSNALYRRFPPGTIILQSALADNKNVTQKTKASPAQAKHRDVPEHELPPERLGPLQKGTGSHLVPSQQHTPTIMNRVLSGSRLHTMTCVGVGED
jgi:hypothetical protein